MTGAVIDLLTTGKSLAWMGGIVTAAAFVVLTLDAVLRRRSPSYAFALAMTGAWLAAEALWGWPSAAAAMAEALRNIGWLWFMAAIAGRRTDSGRLHAVGWIYVGLVAIALLGGIVGSLVERQGHGPSVMLTLAPLRMLVVAGALVLLHNLLDSARSDERRVLSLPIASMAAMWAYDLNLYAIGYLSGEPAGLMLMLRPAGALVLALLLGMAALRPGRQAVQLSRPVAVRSLAFAGVAAWLTALAGVAALAGLAGVEFSWRAQVLVLAIGLLGAALMLVSARVRARLRVLVSKHFFEHRYDYRAEWLRFTSTLNRSAGEATALEARVVKAMADIVESGGGALLSSGADGRLSIATCWPPFSAAVPAELAIEPLAEWMRASGRIVQFDEARRGAALAAELAVIPEWLAENRDWWAAVPLIHQDRLEGVVLLHRPVLERALDWEDFDLLKVAGRQAASYLAEARGSEALLESRRFEEFHRRFAFIMHDVKNLASQLALLARNVERHGDNPAFREDMTATVKLSAERLQSLIARLSAQDRVRVERIEPVDLAVVAAGVAAVKGRQHPVQCGGAASGWVQAEPDLLERLIGHLVQNAVEASPADEPVRLTLSSDGPAATLVIADRGAGMSADFIRTSLFRPFVSTKDGGFGIGAYQARQYAEAMGGTLSVVSREGEGSDFILTLPKAEPGTYHHRREAA